MKTKKNNKGFTLVEVIAVVLIIGIVLLAVVASYSKYIKKTKDNYDKEQTKLFVQAAKDYFSDNREFLPTASGKKSCVTLRTLNQYNYIDKIYDSSKKEYNPDSKVCITKESLTKYSYKGTLLRQGENESQNNTNGLNISYKIGNEDFSSGKTKTGEKDQKYTVKMEIVDNNNHNIKSYKYVIHKISGSKDITYVVKGPFDVSKKQNKISVSIDFNFDGTYYIQAEAINDKNQKITSKSGRLTLSFTKFSCSSAVSIVSDATNWTNSDINNSIIINNKVKYYYLTVKNSSNNSVIEGPIRIDRASLTNGIYNHTITANDNEIKNVYYEIIPYDDNDKNNNCNIKSIEYKIDKVKPTCTVNSVTTGTNPTVKAQCYDQDSKCVNNEVTKVISGSNTSVSVNDNAGNTTECEYQLDTTKPKVTLTSTTNFKKTTQTATLKCVDQSGIVGYYYGTTKPTDSTQYTSVNSTNTFTQNQTISQKGTYYLACKNTLGGWDYTSLTINSYRVINMLVNLDGTVANYNTNDYTKVSDNTYIAPYNTTLTLSSIRTIPTGSGYNAAAPSATTATLSSTNPKLTANSTYTMWFTRNMMYIKYKTGGGTLQTTTHNSDNTATYTWGLDSNNYITRNESNNINYYRYGKTDINLYNYNSREAMYIYRTGYTTNDNEEWICESGCSTANKTFSQDAIILNSSNDLCNASSDDCTPVLKVNWKRRSYTISYTMNGGTNNTNNPASYNVDTSTITIKNPQTRSGYEFKGWTEQVKNLVWWHGFVSAGKGMVETNSSWGSSYFTDMIRLKSGVKYTLSGYGEYPASNIRWRVYNLDGTYSSNGSTTNEYTPSSDCYVRIVFYNNPTSFQVLLQIQLYQKDQLITEHMLQIGLKS